MVTQVWKRYQNESAQKVNPGEENSSTTPVRIQTHNLLIISNLRFPLMSVTLSNHVLHCLHVFPPGG